MPFNLDPKKTALVVIDLQHGIVGLPVQPHSAEAVLNGGRRMAEAFRKRSATVVYVRVDLRNMLPLMVDISHVDPNAEPAAPIASELVPDAGFQQGDLLITKRHWGAFGHTELEAILAGLGIETIVLGGIATNFGVESTARQAASLGFHVVIAEDACSSIDANAHQFAVETILPLIGRVKNTDEIIHALS